MTQSGVAFSYPFWVNTTFPYGDETMSSQQFCRETAHFPLSHARPDQAWRNGAVRSCQDTPLPTSRCIDVVRTLYLPHISLRKRSWQVDERILRQHILPTFASRPLQDISRSDVENWLYSLAGKALAPATCNRALSVFKSLCSLAVLRGQLQSSPCAGIAPLPVQCLREHYLSRSEARRLIQVLRSSSRPEASALRLLLLTSARKNEILRARWEDVHLEQHLLTVPLSKSNRPRHITLSAEAIAVIQHLPRHPECPWLFPGRTQARPLSDIYLFWNRLRQQLDLGDVRIHDLRHTFASILINAGHSLYEVQCLLGHSDPRTTIRYAHLGRDSLLDATSTVETFLAPPSSLQTGDSPASPVPGCRTARQTTPTLIASPQTSVNARPLTDFSKIRRTGKSRTEGIVRLIKKYTLFQEVIFGISRIAEYSPLLTDTLSMLGKYELEI